jgi:hypothetical protein
VRAQEMRNNEQQLGNNPPTQPPQMIDNQLKLPKTGV